MAVLNKFFLLLLITLLSTHLGAQDRLAIPPQYVTVVAGKDFQRSFFHQMLLGRNWRKEWATPVRIQVALLDTLKGGLVPYESSGGGESKSLRLKSTTGKEWVLRSIMKWRTSLLPPVLKNSLYGTLVQEGVSMSHPYAALALPVMMQSAEIYHARPTLVFIPGHAALDTFNKLYANHLYLLEESPVDKKDNAPHLGNFKKYISTIELKDTLRRYNCVNIDQKAFIKARLFDMLISDVDRHEGNWKWGMADTGGITFVPVPNDRDQAFFKHNGLLTQLSIAITRRRFIQSFGYHTKNIKKLTNHNLDFDQSFANQMTYSDWMSAASTLHQALTDSIILQSVQQLPGEVFAISGNEIVNKLKHRRNNLQRYAALFYAAISKKVEVRGSAQKEHFEARGLSNGQMLVNVYRINNKGHKEAAPYYHRVFDCKHTKRITLSGIGGGDVFDVENSKRRMKIIIRKEPVNADTGR